MIWKKIWHDQAWEDYLNLQNNKKLLQKKQITLEYTNGLIEKGGVSTDIFKKSLGTQATKRFFDETLFGTANY